MDNKTKISFYMILGRFQITALVLYLKFSGNIIIGGKGPYEGCLEPMVDLINYDFKYLTKYIVKPEEPFINLYVDECLESKSSVTSTYRMRIISDATY